MATEMRMTKKKKRKCTNLEDGGTSTDAQGFHRPNTNPQTEAASQNVDAHFWLDEANRRTSRTANNIHRLLSERASATPKTSTDTRFP